MNARKGGAPEKGTKQGDSAGIHTEESVRARRQSKEAQQGGTARRDTKQGDTARRHSKETQKARRHSKETQQGDTASTRSMATNHRQSPYTDIKQIKTSDK